MSALFKSKLNSGTTLYDSVDYSSRVDHVSWTEVSMKESLLNEAARLRKELELANETIEYLKDIIAKEQDIWYVSNNRSNYLLQIL